MEPLPREGGRARRGRPGAAHDRRQRRYRRSQARGGRAAGCGTARKGALRDEIQIRLDRFARLEAHMDERLLRHILNNLLSNAVKYSPPGSEVTFSLARRGEQAAIEIQDRGIGIPLEDQPRMFESFHRASNVENRSSTGLGLAIVKKAVELHGGEISLTSAVGSGTRFTVMIPLRPTEQPAGMN